MKIAIAVACAGMMAAGAGRAGAEEKAGTTGAASGEKTSSDQKAVGKLATDFTEAWNRHDAEGLASVYAEDAEMMNPMGRAAKGRQNIAELFKDEHSGRLKNSKMTLTCGPARFLHADVAQLDCDFAVAGIADPAAPAVLRGHSTYIAARNGERWAVATSRSMIPFRMGPGTRAAASATPAGH